MAERGWRPSLRKRYRASREREYRRSDLAVICEFPSMKDALEAYESEEYRELSKLRKEATENSTFTIMEGLDEAAKLRRAMGM